MSAAPEPTYYRMTLTEFARTAFKGKPLSRNTIKTLLANGVWLGEKVGGTYLIFVDDNGQPIAGKPTQTPATGNPEADALIMEWLKTQ